MRIELKSGETVLDLKHRFADAFAGLKIELFSSGHEEGQSSQARSKVNGTVSIDDLIQGLPISVEVNPEMKVSEVEEAFEEAGLHVQVFRKMRGVFIETVQTDHLSLSEQMELSRESTAK